VSSNPDALMKFWQEARKAIGDDLLLGGIYADKRGYHNRRDNLPSSDYSVKLAADKRGPADKASAIDLTFKTAQKSDFRNIAKYSNRLYVGMKNRDSRLFFRGDMKRPVIREFFGNIDLDRDVEGWTFSNSKTGKAGPASSDSSHLWHIHISFHREFCDNWEAASGVLDVLLGRPIKKPEPKDDMPSANEVAKAVWDYRLQPGAFADRIGGYEPDATYPAGGLQVGGDAYGREVHREVVPRIDSIEAELKQINAQQDGRHKELYDMLNGLRAAVAALSDGMSPAVKSRVEATLRGNQ
jgi:hypothetical protein